MMTEAAPDIRGEGAESLESTADLPTVDGEGGGDSLSTGDLFIGENRIFTLSSRFVQSTCSTGDPVVPLLYRNALSASPTLLPARLERASLKKKIRTEANTDKALPHLLHEPHLEGEGP